jgi:membrane protein
MRRQSFKSKIKGRLENLYILDASVSVYILLKLAYKKILNFDLDQRAAAVSFSFMLAVFPGTLFLFTLIPLIPVVGLDKMIMDFSQNLMPKPLYESISNTLYEIISTPRVDILSFGFIFATFAATNGMMSLMRAFNMALKQRERRTYLKARLIALQLTIILVAVLFLSFLILIIGKITLNFLSETVIKNTNFSVWGLNVIGYSTVFFIFYLGISFIYFYAPAMHRRLKFFNFGALLASVLCILVTNIFSYYIENFNSYNRLYGSIGTLIAIMVWIYLIALILIIGFEVNIGLRSAKIRTLQYKNRKTTKTIRK